MCCHSNISYNEKVVELRLNYNFFVVGGAVAGVSLPLLNKSIPILNFPAINHPII